MPNTDPIKNSEWERFRELINKDCPYCGHPMELVRDDEKGTWICLFCEYQEPEILEDK